jgi:hypothetical protein
MWLFTIIGFFSIVQKEGQEHLTVRARVATDLERLRQQFMPELSETTAHKGTDYPYRATIDKEAFACGLGRLGRAIDYTNFKNAVRSRARPGRVHVYSKVWSMLIELERLQERKER